MQSPVHLRTARALAMAAELAPIMCPEWCSCAPKWAPIMRCDLEGWEALQPKYEEKGDNRWVMMWTEEESKQDEVIAMDHRWHHVASTPTELHAARPSGFALQ